MNVLDILGTGCSIAEWYKALKEHYADVKQKIQDAFVKSFSVMAKEIWGGEFDQDKLINIITQMEQEDLLVFSLSEKIMHDIIVGVCGEGISVYLRENKFFDIFNKSYVGACAKDDAITKYMLVSKICGLEKEKEHLISQTEKEYDKLIEYINADIQRNRKGDMYNNVNFVLDILCPYCMDNLRVGCSRNVLNMGYDLTDILEHIGEYDRAVELADTISELIKRHEEMDVKDIQKYIGCAYTFAIARPKNTDDRDKLLNTAENMLNHCRCILDSAQTQLSKPEQWFLGGLFHSDYAAYLLNRGQMAENHSVDGYEKYYEEALQEHKKSLADREKYFNSLSSLDETGRDNAQRRIIQSRSNIAYSKEYLRQYDIAIEEYENVVKMWDDKNELTRSFLTKRYIIRTYLKKAELELLKLDQKEHCLMYLQDCLEYYETVPDQKAYNQVIEMKQKLERI